MPILKSEYQPPVFLRNPHLATIVPSVWRKVKGVKYQRERIHTPDGDFLDLDWVRNNHKKLVVISHGLEGSSERPYIKGMAKFYAENDWDVLAWNCRSCSGELNWKPRFYHHGATEDLTQVIDYAIDKHGYEEVYLTGFSMGGSMTLKYLGEMGKNTPSQVVGGATFSVPVSLASSVEKLSTWGTGFYRKRFMNKLEKKIKAKADQFKEIDYADFSAIKYFPDFDNLYTAPLHGFKNADDFYQKASAGNFIESISLPTLLVNATNDPFLGDECYPKDKCLNHKDLYLEMPKHGGHVGFGLKNDEFNYMERRSLAFYNKYITKK